MLTKPLNATLNINIKKVNIDRINHQVRFASLASSSSSNLNPAPTPPPAATTSSLSSPELPPQVETEVFLSRYRSPQVHDTARIRPSYYTSKSGSPAIKLATREDFIRREKMREEGGMDSTPRDRRLAVEKLWSGGDPSPIVPSHCHTTNKRHCLVFPGSGSQYVGQGSFLEEYSSARRMWDEAEESLSGFEQWRRSLRLEDQPGDVGILGRMLEDAHDERILETPLKKVVFDGPQDELTRSTNAQPAILITSMATLRTLEAEFASTVVSDAEYFLGHSSGEYTAMVASGACSFADGVRLTRLHGLLTTHALSLPEINLSSSPSAPSITRGVMSAIIINPGHSHAEVAELLAGLNGEGRVEVASFNSKTQIVLAGCREGILRASEVLRERDIAVRVADLPVSAPFHCSFMRPAGDAMQHALSHPSVVLSTPSAPLISNGDGSVISTPSSLIDNLVSQISSPVRWTSCLTTARTAGIGRMIFLGPGKSLSNLARKDLMSDQMERNVEVVSVAMKEDMERLKKLWDVEQAERMDSKLLDL